MMMAMRWHRWLSFLLIVVFLVSIVGCGGGGAPAGGDGGGDGGGGGDGDGDGGMTMDLSPAGPSPNNVEVIVGAQTSATPDAQGHVDAAPEDGATCTVFATDTQSGDLMLMSVVPADATSTAQTGDAAAITPESTVLALLFFRMGGWLVPQESHDQVLELFSGLSDVQAAVDLLAAEYQQTGSPLETLVGDAQFDSAMNAAAAAASQALANSPLAEDMRLALGNLEVQTNQAQTSSWECDPWFGEGVELTYKDDTEHPDQVDILGTNNLCIYRWAEISDPETDEPLGWKILGDAGLILGASETTLAPDPLPKKSPLNLTVTGGLEGFDPAKAGMEHVVPAGMTVSLRVIIPVISCIVGVPGVKSFNPIATAKAADGGWKTGHPLVNYSLKQFVWDWKQPVASAGKPVPSLMQNLSIAAASGDGLIDVVTNWTWQTLLPAAAQDPGGLGAAVIGEFGGKFAASLVAQSIGLIAAPWLIVAIRGYMIADTIVKAGPAAIDLFKAQMETYFIISASGWGEVIISSSPTTRGR